MGTSSKPPSSKSPSPSPSPTHSTIFSRWSSASLQWTGFTSHQNLLLFLGTVGVFAIFSMSQTTWMRPQAPGGKFWFERSWRLGWGLKWHAWLMIGMCSPFSSFPRLETGFGSFGADLISQSCGYIAATAIPAKCKSEEANSPSLARTPPGSRCKFGECGRYDGYASFLRRDDHCSDVVWNFGCY